MRRCSERRWTLCCLAGLALAAILVPDRPGDASSPCQWDKHTAISAHVELQSQETGVVRPGETVTFTLVFVDKDKCGTDIVDDYLGGASWQVGTNEGSGISFPWTAPGCVDDTTVFSGSVRVRDSGTKGLDPEVNVPFSFTVCPG